MSMKSDKNKEKKLSPEKEQAKVQLMYTRFTKMRNAKSELVSKWQMIDMFDRGEQWKNAPLPPWIPRPNTNWIKFVRTLKRANLALTIPESDFTPISPEDAGIVDDLQTAHDHVWHEQQVPRTIRRCIDRSFLYGTSVAWIYYEEAPKGKYFKDKNLSKFNQMYAGEVKVKRVRAGNFFIDPDAYTIEEAKYCEVTEIMPLSSVKNNPLFKEYAGEQLANLSSSELEMQGEANGDIFDRDNTLTNGNLTNQKEDYMATVHIHFERYKNSEGRYQLDITYYLSFANFILYRVEDAQPNELPFAVLYDEEEENDFWGTSTAMDILDNQKIISKAEQAASTIVTLHQNPQKVVQRESGINPNELARTGTLPGKVYQSNIPNPIEILEHPDIPKGNFELQDRLVNNIKEYVGANEAYTGQSVGSLTTSTGVSSLIDRATVRDKDKALQINAFVERISDLIVKFIIMHWKEERPMMTQAPNGQPQYSQWQPLGKEFTPDNICYRVKNDVYVHTPVSVSQRREQADKMMQLQGQFQYNPPIITQEEWLMLQDFPNKHQILQRIEEDRRRITQMESQNAVENIMQIIKQANLLTSQGMAPQEIQAQVAQMAQQVVQQVISTGASQTMDSAGQAANIGGGSTPSSGSTPNGALGMQQAMNMGQGS